MARPAAEARIPQEGTVPGRRRLAVGRRRRLAIALGVSAALLAVQSLEGPSTLIAAGRPHPPVTPAGVVALDLPGDSTEPPQASDPSPESPEALKEDTPPHLLGFAHGPFIAPSSLGAHRLSDIPASGFDATAPVVALTFDDGPDPRYTPEVLDILARHQTPATFFMVGRMAAAHPELVGLVAAAGQSIGGHTWNHVNLKTIRDTLYPVEVDATDNLLGSLSGHRIVCVRPPRGESDPRVTALLAARGMTNTLWSVDPTDWARPGAPAIVQRVLGAAAPGSIILLHDGGGDRSQTVAALPLILDGLRSRGLTPVPMCA